MRHRHANATKTPRILALFLAVPLIAASCSGSTNDTSNSDGDDATGESDRSATEVIEQDFAKETNDTPINTIQSIVSSAAQSGEGVFLSDNINDELKENLLPEIGSLQSAPDFGIPLEFTDGQILVRAVFTPQGAAEQRYVYFLEPTSAGEESQQWAVYDVLRGGARSAASTDHEQVKIGTTEYTEADLQHMAENVATGKYGWKDDPYFTALGDGIEFGFDPHQDVYTLLDQTNTTAKIEVVHNLEEFFDIDLELTEQSGATFWRITNITQKTDTELF